jgi:hypothetical protein
MVHESGSLPVKHSYLVLPSWFPGAIWDTTIATYTSNTSFTLTAGSADNNAYRNCMCVIVDQDSVRSENRIEMSISANSKQAMHQSPEQKE